MNEADALDIVNQAIWTVIVAAGRRPGRRRRIVKFEVNLLDDSAG